MKVFFYILSMVMMFFSAMLYKLTKPLTELELANGAIPFNHNEELIHRFSQVLLLASCAVMIILVVKAIINPSYFVDSSREDEENEYLQSKVDE